MASQFRTTSDNIRISITATQLRYMASSSPVPRENYKNGTLVTGQSRQSQRTLPSSFFFSAEFTEEFRLLRKMFKALEGVYSYVVDACEELGTGIAEIGGSMNSTLAGGEATTKAVAEAVAAADRALVAIMLQCGGEGGGGSSGGSEGGGGGNNSTDSSPPSTVLLRFIKIASQVEQHCGNLLTLLKKAQAQPPSPNTQT